MSLFCLKHGNGSLHLQIKIKFSWCGMLGSASFDPAFLSFQHHFFLLPLHAHQPQTPIYMQVQPVSGLFAFTHTVSAVCYVPFFPGLSSYSSFRICLLQEAFLNQCQPYFLFPTPCMYESMLYTSVCPCHLGKLCSLGTWNISFPGLPKYTAEFIM